MRRLAAAVKPDGAKCLRRSTLCQVWHHVRPSANATDSNVPQHAKNNQSSPEFVALGTRGVTLCVARKGVGPPLLALTGTGGDLRAPSGRVFLDSPYLNRAFEVVSFDHRALGRSSGPAGKYAMADYADDAAALLDTLGWHTPVRVLGASFGGMVAMMLAIRRPERVGRLALLCSSPGGALPSFPLQEWMELPPEDAALNLAKRLDTRPEMRDTNVRVFAQSLTRGEQRVRKSAGHQRQLLARAEHDCYATLGAIKMPTLISGARHDGIAPLEAQYFMHAAIPGSELQLYDGGHFYFVADSGAALQGAAEFLLRDF